MQRVLFFMAMMLVSLHSIAQNITENIDAFTDDIQFRSAAMQASENTETELREILLETTEYGQVGSLLSTLSLPASCVIRVTGPVDIADTQALAKASRLGCIIKILDLSNAKIKDNIF